MCGANMTSQKKIEANRRNAQKSTGPRTAGGKDRVRRNALSLGLYAQATLLPGEDEAEYLQLLAAHFDLWDPANLVEDLYVAEIADLRWKLNRLNRGEQAYLSDCVYIEAARREYKPESQGVILGGEMAQIRKAIDLALLEKGRHLEPGAQDLREASKRTLTDAGHMQVGAHIDSRRMHLVRSLKRAEAALTAQQEKRMTVDVTPAPAGGT
jgi:hypothetical protein